MRGRAGCQPRMVPSVTTDSALSWWEGGSLSRPLSVVCQLNTQAVKLADELTFRVWEMPGETKAGDRLKGPREHWVSNTVSAASGSPSQSRWPRDRHDNDSGRQEGGETTVKTIGSGSASSRLASQKPVDRPVS